MKYQREAAFLKDQMGESVRAILAETGGFIAGGAITSAFSAAPVNDFDVFFQTQQALDQAIAAIPRDDKTVITDSAVSVVIDKHRVQLIKCVVRPMPEVINGFDFTICQGAFNLEQFIFGEDFFRHLAQRRLVFNMAAEFPICSLYRARKFIKRGFHFSGIEAIKLGLRIQALEIETYADLRKQLMGIDTLFLKELTDAIAGQQEKKYDMGEFLETLNVWLEKLDALTGEPE